MILIRIRAGAWLDKVPIIIGSVRQIATILNAPLAMHTWLHLQPDSPARLLRQQFLRTPL